MNNDTFFVSVIVPDVRMFSKMKVNCASVRGSHIPKDRRGKEQIYEEDTFEIYHRKHFREEGRRMREDVGVSTSIILDWLLRSGEKMNRNIGSREKFIAWYDFAVRHRD